MLHNEIMTETYLEVFIKRYCIPSRWTYRMSSYGLKELFEQLTCDYISNEQFKNAMISAGFQPTMKSATHVNHRYKIVVRDCPEVPAKFRGKGLQSYLYE